MMTCSPSCSPYHVVNFLIFWLLKLYDILTPKFPHADSISEHYFSKISWGACPRPLSISMLFMLTVLHTITHTIIQYTEAHTLNMCPRSGKYIFLHPLVCQICVCFQEDHTTLPPQYSHPILTPLGKRNPDRVINLWLCCIIAMHNHIQ